ncbi:ATP-dependent DNA helicase RecG [Gleimia sp. 6138-11-ORH1]|uniref:ATP-dependent DNA helicase RecG n=1 Tax=Gleimia sp. 6138-11-ORH1 TaxID=2973937 RepID=UPI00216701BE|nr:ATP-dependent DNA helicase RecG [Gleimia sp. 6138-11-ORH1]MCS4484515.1 ATP-dependent DNA helicase RecG [Gleimia sp. 6138-11-ORH1]
MPPKDFLATPLERLVGTATAKKLATLGLETAADLIHFYPRKYLHWGKLTPLHSLFPGEEATILASVKNAQIHANRNGGVRLTVELTDGFYTLNATFFATHPAKLSVHQRLLKPGTQHLFAGTISHYKGQLQLTHPSFEEVEPNEINRVLTRPIAVYPANPKCPTWLTAKAVGIVVDQLHPEDILDPFTAAEQKEYQLQPLLKAIQQIHRPETDAEISAAKQTLKWVEAFELQVAFALDRQQNTEKRAHPIPKTAAAIHAEIIENFGFPLTGGQQTAIDTILSEMEKETPMQRLLQADVGAGKTIVAGILMATVVNAGFQAALLAPTEVLAAQHFETLTNLLPVPVELLTGSSNTKNRKRINQIAASGQPTLLVGTHALLQDSVELSRLALVVIDEQHRFGVAQREKLRENQTKVPHLLTMTATPIPRTIAMTVFGDLDITEIRELPTGRIPVKTFLVNEANSSWMERVWVRSREEINAGGRVFVVAPRIGDEADSQLASVVETAEKLKQLEVFQGIEIGILHGKLPAEEKQTLIDDFNAGKLNLLVTTTVIEVGVDIRAASLMVILDAQQFGLSQLHQLRGRVGRGGQAATCIAVHTAEITADSLARLEAFAQHNSGFDLAEIDLKLRKEGNVLGQNQSGNVTSLKALRVLRDGKIITAARELAQRVIAADPHLTNRPLLAQRVELAKQAAQWMDRV